MGEESKVVFQMALMRLIAGSIEVTAALLMLRFGRVATALQINGVLGLIGPVILITVSTLGILGMANQVSLIKLVIIALGVCCIFIGTR